MRLCRDSRTPPPTARLVLADGTVIRGEGLGATGAQVGELCFNTAMTGYQEILTDPSYAGQIVTFTFPHIGNVGANDEDVENSSEPAASAARGAVLRAPATTPSNYRARLDLSAWMRRRGIVGVAGVDTRMLTARIREEGVMTAVVAHQPSGAFDEAALIEKARAWKGLEGRDLARAASGSAAYAEAGGDWLWNEGFGEGDPQGPHAVVIDYGVKRNILRRLVGAGCRVSVVPATATYDEVMALAPDGVVLANGPGDPAATAEYAVPVIQRLIEAKVPLFGICLGHQLLALAVGARTVKMAQGHHGANHPVRDETTGKVEIVSMNHGFTVDASTLPDRVEVTHTSLFDGTNSGFRLKDAPALSVQHHPEASPGPQDSFRAFDRFVEMMREENAAA
jgi:carbamoyl-phosphate synthase small subunit